ncbi:MAG: hypothetical protein ABW162_01650 [Candidatus Sedimenticola sp. PURPLELP]
MLEYIFFDERPWNRFTEFLQQKGLSPQAEHEEQGYMVRLPEDTDDELMDGIEDFYDEMLDMNQALFTEEEGEDHRHSAGVTVNLSDGRTVQAAVDPGLLNRILEVVSTEELGLLVNAIADAVENPDDRSICRR